MVWHKLYCDNVQNNNADSVLICISFFSLYSHVVCLLLFSSAHVILVLTSPPVCSIQVPKTVLKGKDVQVDIRKKQLCVRYRGPTGEWEEGASGELTWEVRPEECMWTLSPGQHVHVSSSWTV